MKAILQSLELWLTTWANGAITSSAFGQVEVSVERTAAHYLMLFSILMTGS